MMRGPVTPEDLARVPLILPEARWGSALGAPRPPLHETFAFITRRDAHLSPATQVLTQLARQHLRRLPPDGAARRS